MWTVWIAASRTPRNDREHAMTILRHCERSEATQDKMGAAPVAGAAPKKS